MYKRVGSTSQLYFRTILFVGLNVDQHGRFSDNVLRAGHLTHGLLSDWFQDVSHETLA